MLHEYQCKRRTISIFVLTSNPPTTLGVTSALSMPKNANSLWTITGHFGYGNIHGPGVGHLKIVLTFDVSALFKYFASSVLYLPRFISQHFSGHRSQY